MEEFFTLYKNEILGTVFSIIILVIIRFAAVGTIRRIGRRSDISTSRTKLIVKYISLGITAIALVTITLIWGVNFRELGLIFSSIFAVIGVALFAQWSILSNITAGIILFLAFPFKIGDRIKIMDKELETEEEFTIEDIKLYYIYLKNSQGHLITYPNNLMMQKAVTLLKSSRSDSDS